jgi:hypothetical protein
MLLEFDQCVVIYAYLAFRQPSKLQRQCCLCFYPPNIINPMCIEQLREMDPPPSQNTVGFCKQITLLILYYISSRSITLLKVIDAPLRVYDIFYLTANCKFINFSFRIFLLFVPGMSASYKSYIL